MAAQSRTLYEPRDWQRIVHECPARFRVVIVHRRGGKTVLGGNEVIAYAGSDMTGRADKPATYIYFAPERAQAKKVMWDQMVAQAKRLDPSCKVNIADLQIDMKGYRRVFLSGSDNPDNVRGVGPRGVLLDEFDDMHPDLWPLVVRPSLADSGGWALIYGTPKGRGKLYERYEHAGNPENTEWARFMFRASETGILPESELASLRAEMTAEQYAQEFECSFAAAITGAYYANEIEQARNGTPCRVTRVPHDPMLPVHTAWDLGWSDATVVVFFQIVGKEIWIIDYQEWTHTALDIICRDVLARGWSFGEHLLPHDVAVTELGSGTSRREIVESLLRRPIRVLPATRVDDGITAVRLTLPRMWFDAEKCKTLLWRLERYTVESRRRGEAHEQSHAADGVRTLVQGLPFLVTMAPMQPWKPRKRVA